MLFTHRIKNFVPVLYYRFPVSVYHKTLVNRTCNSLISLINHDWSRPGPVIATGPHKYVNYDHPGEGSPEKDCMR